MNNNNNNNYNDNYDGTNTFGGDTPKENDYTTSYSSGKANSSEEIFSNSRSYYNSTENESETQNASTQSGFFDADGNYRRKYSPDDQPSGRYESSGFSSTRYINNDTDSTAQNTQQYSSTAQNGGGYYTTPQSYYTPTQNQQADKKRKKEKKKHGRAGMAIAMVCCILASGALGFGGGVLALKVSQNNGSADGNGVTINKVVETVSTSSDSSGSMTTEDIVKKTENSVVEIMTETVTTGSFTGNYITAGAGSGVIISENGYIVTNNHVIEDANTITVTTKDGKSYDAKLVGTASPTLDIALLKIDATGLTPASTGDSDKLAVGEKAVAIGNPLGQLGGTVTEGIISALNRDIAIDGVTMNLLQTNAEINPGNSGGGLFDDHGNLIGIVVAKSTGDEIEGLGFAIPINDVTKVVEDLTEYGYVKGVIDTGLSLLDISNNQTAMMYGVSETGVYIQSVASGSEAEKSGFSRGDRIVAVEGTEVTTSTEFDAAIKKYSVGDTVTITISRGGRETELSLILEESTPTSSSNSFSNGNSNNSQNDSDNGYYGGGLEDYFNNFF